MREVRTLRGFQYEASLGGLGALTISPALASNISSATNVINTASSVIPQQSIQIQTKFSKVANTIAGIAGTVAAIAAVIPAPPFVGQVVAVVAGIVAAVAAILGKIFARAKSKELDAERAQWDTANAKLREENAELDLKYENLKANMATLRQVVTDVTGIDFNFGKDNTVQGLGLCIFNCKKKAAEQNLNTSKQQNASLIKAQNEKIALCEGLIKEWDTLTAALLNFKKKGNSNAGIIVGIGFAALIGGYAIFKK
jgi:hypothetical protein